MKAWDNFLAVQETEVGAEVVAKWLRPLKVVKFDACNLYLEAKDSFHAMWFEEHVRPKLQTRLLNNNGRRIMVHLAVAGAPDKTGSQKGKGNKAQAAAAPTPFSLAYDTLDPYCTLERFVVSEANELVFRLVSEVTGFDASQGTVEASRRVLCTFNPIYLHGPTGSGRTHLMMAMAHALRHQRMNVVYARAETFTQHVVSAIRAGEMRTFRQAYRDIDALLLDDVHVFSRKGATQEELFHTFNTLHVAGKQIILSAHCSPQELQLIEPRLVSRFEWGIVLPVEALGREGSAQALHAKADALHFPLSGGVVNFLLDTFSGSAKGLMRALEALILRSHMHRYEGRGESSAITPSLAKAYLSDLLEEQRRGQITSTTIVEKVAEYYGMTTEDILGKSQSRDCVGPRQVAMYLCRSLLKLPYQKIGDVFGRDHSTVMSRVKRVQHALDVNDADILAVIGRLSKALS